MKQGGNIFSPLLISIRITQWRTLKSLNRVSNFKTKEHEKF